MMNPFDDAASTINESVWQSIKRDVGQVARRLRLVMMPGFSTEAIRAELRDWELWGPLFICMTLALILSFEASDEASLVFSVIFVVVWVGSAIVTINAQLLGGKISFFQTLCLMGYCIFPLLVSSGLCFMWNHIVPANIAVLLRFLTVLLALSWSTWASSSFMADARFPTGRKLLALYPVVLFYVSLAWMILIGFQQVGSGSDDSGSIQDSPSEPAPTPKPDGSNDAPVGSPAPLPPSAATAVMLLSEAVSRVFARS